MRPTPCCNILRKAPAWRSKMRSGSPTRPTKIRMTSPRLSAPMCSSVTCARRGYRLWRASMASSTTHAARQRNCGIRCSAHARRKRPTTAWRGFTAGCKGALIGPLLFATLFVLPQLSQRRLDPRRTERQVADPPAGCVRDGVGDRGGRRAQRGFAGAERTFVRAVDQLDVDDRRFRHGEDRIARPVARPNAALLETHLLLQGPAR